MMVPRSESALRERHSETCPRVSDHDAECLVCEAFQLRAGERSAVVAYLLRAATGHTKHAAALRADAGTQADVEARGYERIASVLTDAARAIGEGRHWR